MSAPAPTQTSAAASAVDEARVDRVRARYAKHGKLRFVSAIDLGRIWERAMRKADLPIAYSEGFSPHPKISFPDALPLGYASTCEYVELTFAAPVVLSEAVRRLNEAFPPGLEVLHAEPVPSGAPKFAKGLKASLWAMDYPADVDADALAAAVDAVRSAAALPVLRQRKGDPVEVDLRPAIASISISSSTQAAAVQRRTPRVLVVLHHLEPPVRPTEVHLALADHHKPTTAEPLPEPALVTRLAQGTATDEGVAEALTGAVHAPSPPRSTP